MTGGPDFCTDFDSDGIVTLLDAVLLSVALVNGDACLRQ
jgi:hypothetical protein